MNITNKIVALSSAVAFALQITLALLMLRYFSPEEVGMFSVISQIGFFWTTLALAQTPLQLLANHGASVLDDARHAWILSMQRFMWLVPVAALAVWWSGLSFVSALLSALLLSLCQLTWMLAQSMHLRMSHAWAQVGVRVLPPLMALLVAAAAVYKQWDGPALLGAALLGYATGAAWLLPTLLTFWRGKFDGASTKSDEIAPSSALQNFSHQEIAPVSGDNRSAALRMAHTLADALLATAIVVVWQRLYGAQETGWLTAPLRVMGFVPAVVHMAWAQVLLSKPKSSSVDPIRVGLGGFAFVALLGAICAFALEIGFIDSKWQGVRSYLLPLVLWQGSACLTSAVSYRPFEILSGERYSWICLCLIGLQLFVLFLPFALTGFTFLSTHLWSFCLASAIGLTVVTKLIK